jgi:hypothetical protein
MPDIHKLHDEVRRFLLFEWDPIGVKDTSSTQDEYDSYALPIVQAILKRRNVVELRDQLLKIEVELMGLEGDPNRASFVAAKLADLGYLA